MRHLFPYCNTIVGLALLALLGTILLTSLSEPDLGLSYPEYSGQSAAIAQSVVSTIPNSGERRWFLSFHLNQSS